MESVPNNFIEDIKRIVITIIDQLEELKARRIRGVQEIDGNYNQYIKLDNSGNVIIQCDNGQYVGIQENPA